MVVATHPIQYQTPLYRFLSEKGIPVHVLFLSRHGLDVTRDRDFGLEFAWDVSLLDGLSYEFLPPVMGKGRSPSHFWSLINRGLVERLSPERFSAMWINGYRYASLVGAVITAASRGLPILYRSETNHMTSPPGPARSVMSAVFKRSSIRCLSIGSLNDQFYAGIGVPAHRRFLVPYSVDNARFRTAAQGLSKAEARKLLGLDKDAIVVLYVGKLVPWKRPDLLLRAVASLQRRDVHIAYVGDGRLRESLEHQSRTEGIDARFVGFLNQTEIVRAYAAADLLALPSEHEPWGLVVNEAMNFGLPILVSDHIGCGPDLVGDHGSGMIFESGNVEDLARCLSAMLADPRRLEAMSNASRRRISEWGFEGCAVGVRAALNSVTGGPTDLL